MGIHIEKTNGEQIIKLSKDISREGIKEILDEKHYCMRIISMQENPKVIFDRSIDQKSLSHEKKEIINELNDFLISRCDRVATLFNSPKEKLKYNYEFQNKRRLLKTKGFTKNEFGRAKSFLNYPEI